MPGQTALLLGATGQVGKEVLKLLLSSPEFSKVGEFGRRVTDVSSFEGKDKLVQKTIDFEKLEDAGLAKEHWDVVFITLGTTKKAAGSAKAFEKIDREYVLNAARAAKADNPQRLVYVSAIAADPSSSLLYARSKGLTEQGLASLGYDDTIVFRPAMLAGTARSDSRIFESAFLLFSGLAARVTDSVQIRVDTLAKSVVEAGRLGSSGLPVSAKATKAGKEGSFFTLIGNAGALNFAKTL